MATHTKMVSCTCGWPVEVRVNPHGHHGLTILQLVDRYGKHGQWIVLIIFLAVATHSKSPLVSFRMLKMAED